MANLDYLKTKRGIIKIVQIILGLICIYLLCGPGTNCFQRGERLAFASAVNAAFLFLNIILFSNVYKIILTVVDVSAIAKIEKYYAILGLILFAVAFGLMLWYNVQFRGPGEWIAAMVILGIIGGLFAFDFMILSGKASD